MVDFNKKIYNSDKFRLAAIFFKEHNCYTLAPRGTTDYIQYWDRETLRCLNGYVAPDGDSITGYHYFYLNYSPIMRLASTEYVDRYGNIRTRRERVLEFPCFWDGDYYYFNAIELAEQEGKHMAVLKARQKGYSFKGASMLVRNYELIPGSKNFAVASEQKFLIGDGLLTKAWQIMDFIDKNTAWSKQRLVSTRMERVSGYKITDEFGKQTEQGYLSSITGITLKNDPERLRGTRGKLVLFEEGGKFPNLETAWRIEQPAVETDDGMAFGMLIAYGTGGTEGGSFDGLKNLFYNPKAFNVLSFPNIWDDGAEQTECGFFHPAWLNMEGENKDGQRFMDNDGNTNRELAVEELMNQRNIIREGGASLTSIDRFVSERPLKPQEAVLELGKNIFPRKLLMDQLTRIRTNEKIKNMKHIVDLAWDGDGKVQATEKKSGDITTYHLKRDDKPRGSIVIWEYPVQDPPFGLYIGGCLTPGEKVWTQRGLVNVEEVDLGDKLVNKDGKLVDIRNLQRYEKKDEPVYKIKLANCYRTTTFTQEHPLWIGNETFDFVKAKFAKVGQYAEVPNVYRSNLYQKRYTSYAMDFWWIVGLWLGDGWCDNRGRIFISFDINLPYYSDKFITIAKRFSDHLYTRERCGQLEISFTNKKFANWLTQTFGKYAYGKRIPENIKHIRREYQTSLVYGYLASDGCVYTNKNGYSSIEFVSINLELLESIQDLCFALDSCGGISKLRSAKLGNIQGRIVNLKDCYHLRFCHRETVKLASEIKTFYLDDIKLSKINYQKNLTNRGKNDCFLSEDKTKIYFKIKQIDRYLYTGTVYNFECDTHTFGCRCIMTHNCDPLTDQRV